MSVALFLVSPIYLTLIIEFCIRFVAHTYGEGEAVCFDASVLALILVVIALILVVIVRRFRPIHQPPPMRRLPFSTPMKTHHTR